MSERVVNMAKAGRPKIVWSDKDYKTFEGLCSIQATIEEIEHVLNITYKTLNRLCKEHYQTEDGQPMDFSTTYKKYSETGKISLRRYQFKLAEKNAAMAIWLGKQYLGQRDNLDVQTESPSINISIESATTEDVGAN